MDCAVLGAIETGTHVLFAGGVVDIALVSERKPLIWHERRYKSLAETAPADVLTFPNTLKAESNQ
jgi:flavin reductase